MKTYSSSQRPSQSWKNSPSTAQYILRNPFAVEKMTLESPTDTIAFVALSGVITRAAYKTIRAPKRKFNSII
ncbi:MAG TPA: hypothetical protein VG146_19870 [Verrucomicrobiae bacterium]|nr:hypothetical protein [Verrucomicrobiae bacterium]